MTSEQIELAGGNLIMNVRRHLASLAPRLVSMRIRDDPS